MGTSATISHAAGKKAAYYYLSRPDIEEADVAAVVGVLRSPHLALGPCLDAFEKSFASYIGCRRAVAVNSGTSGLHLAVRALGIKDGDEVITTPFSFVASANCMIFERAVPRFVDIDPVTLNMDASKIAKALTKRTKAILPVHIFGLPCDMDAIVSIATKTGLAVIEDACEAVGATYNGHKAGTFGDAAVFAFYPNKQMTTGEGGILVTDSLEIAAAARSMRNQGRSENGTWLEHERLGFNYRMDEMSAALGLSQLSRIEGILARRAEVAAWYAEALSGVTGVRPLPEVPGSTRSWFVYVVILERGADRNAVIKRLEALGVQSRAYFPPIHLQPFYSRRFGYKPGAFPVCEDVSARTLTLPFYNALAPGDVEEVVARLKRALV
jgi:perosamine synthetase